jgi:transposase
MEQRYQAVVAVVQDGWKITEVADRLGVTRQAVHKWIGRYEAGGLSRKHPGWGPRRILHQLERQGVDPLPGRSSIYRCLKRHNLIELRRRKKRRDEFRRWERDRPMHSWVPRRSSDDVQAGRRGHSPSPSYVGSGGRSWITHAASLSARLSSLTSSRSISTNRRLSAGPPIPEHGERRGLPVAQCVRREPAARNPRRAQPPPVAGQDVLVYDDVFTDGLTLREIARRHHQLVSGQKTILGPQLDFDQMWRGNLSRNRDTRTTCQRS